jgi:hypothetical protein
VAFKFSLNSNVGKERAKRNNEKNTKDNKHGGSVHAVQNGSEWQASVDPCGSVSTPEGDDKPLE